MNWLKNYDLCSHFTYKILERNRPEQRNNVKDKDTKTDRQTDSERQRQVKEH